MASYSPIEPENPAVEDPKVDIPRIDLNPWDHKLPIAIHWTILIISSCVIPVVFYFALRYGAHLHLPIVLAITTSIFGAVTLFSLVKRTWLLLRAKSTCRPLGGSKWELDYFHWNFMIGFVCVTAIIVAGNVTHNVRVVALGLPILLIDVCGQLLLVGIMYAIGASSPIRMSSVEKGDNIRSGVYAIVEDIVAVDGGQGQQYRRQLQARYFASSTIRNLCFQLDLLWGVTGLAAAGLSIGLVFGVENANVGYTMGWIVPWVYAGIMALVTIRMTSAALRRETRASMNSSTMQSTAYAK